MTVHVHDLHGETWPFSDPENAASFVCACVHKRFKPLLRVLRDDEGEWQFLCGEDEHIEAQPVLICLGCMIEREPSLLRVSKLPIGECAGRDSETAEWEW
jgi:hypothetical protein